MSDSEYWRILNLRSKVLVGFEIVVEYMYRAREVGDLGEYSDLVGGIQLVRIYSILYFNYRPFLRLKTGCRSWMLRFSILYYFWDTKTQTFCLSLLHLSGIHSSFILYTLGTRCFPDTYYLTYLKWMYLLEYVLGIIFFWNSKGAHFWANLHSTLTE